MENLKINIQNARQKGYSDERIKEALIRAGWPAGRVEQAFADLSTQTPPPAVEPQPEPAAQPHAINDQPAQQPPDPKPEQGFSPSFEPNVNHAARHSTAKPRLTKLLVPAASAV